ncbi:DUF4097 family beta strand repeat-containing protein [Microbacterium sp.]|uniref:DUF4097 family beta strand repeat-containing protein n=1 Tax=Microbacterium sp. TaxID=51671 RepID=UPI003F9CD7C2
MNEQKQDNSGFKTVAIITAVVGGIALIGSGTTAAFGAVNALGQGNGSDQSDRVDVSGVTELIADVAASDVTIRFGDVDEAELQVSGSDGRWTLERDGDELKLRSPDSWLSWGGDWSWFGDWGREENVDLLLPQELAGIDADLSLGAGALDVEGEFGEFEVDISAGSVHVNGSATALDAELNAGRAEFELADVDTASFGVSAGELVSTLTGSAPREVEVGVSAGSLTLALPDVPYDVTQDVSAGSVDNDLQTASNSRNSVRVDVSAGNVKLRTSD